MKRLATLFWELFKVSLFVIGGGYAIIAVADAVFARKKWTEEGELIDKLPVFQMVPGLIATHTAVCLGRKMAGLPGAAVGVLAVALPAVMVFLLVSAFYDRLPLSHPILLSAFIGLRASLTGIIAATLLRSWRKAFSDVFPALIFGAVLFLLLWGVPVWATLLGAMAAGLVSVFAAHGGATPTKTFSCSLLPLLVFLKYGALCFGGGFVLVPMYLEDFVGPTAPFVQLSETTFADVMALSQMTPGPIGVNCATFFGYRLAGVGGAILASVLLLVPGSLLVCLALGSLDRFRENRIVKGILRGARPASLALMFVALAAFLKLSVFDATGAFSPIGAALVILAALLIMKKKIHPVLLIVLSACAAGVLRADEAITTDRYPDADTVVVDERTRVAYKSDGTYTETAETWEKLLTEKGRRESSVFSLDYSRRYGSARIVFVGAVGTNGVERTIDVSATTRDATDNSSMSANIYDPLDRRLVCTIPGLQIGETLHVKTERVAEKPRCENQWSDLNVFEWTHPIVRARWEIVAPRERPLRKIAVRHPLGNVTESRRTLDDGSTLHVFACTNSPQAFPEPDMPALYTQLQNIRVSTAADWPEISRWYWNLSAPHLAKTNAAMVAEVKRLTAACTNRTDALRRVFTFVSQEIRYMGLTMEDTSPGYAPHDVDLTFSNRYGVCRDKAGLLVALLRLAGFEAYPVLIHVGAKLDPEVPQPFFNHAIVAVDEGSRRYILMDPTNENTTDLLPAYESDKSYLVARPDGENLRTTPTPPPDHNRLAVVSTGRLEKDGSLDLTSEIAFGGVNDTIYRNALVQKTPDERTRFFERVVRSLAAGAELLTCEIRPADLRDTMEPLAVKLVSRLPEMILRGETRDTLQVPFLSSRFGLANFLLAGNTSLEQRRFPLVVDATAAAEESVEIDLADAVGGVASLPPDEAIADGYDFTRSFSVTNGRLRVARRLAVSRVEFSPKDYADIREDIKQTEAAARKSPVFHADSFAGADVRWLLDSTDVTILSDRAWIVTNRVEKEILTYKGKKRSAEMKFSYNPSVGSVALVEAVVSNRNGSVRAVTPKELNVMDAGWVASAPRYPASKMLIVNLPSVEIGSVIRATWVRTVTNAPAAFYGAFLFDSHEPLDRRVVRVNDWRREVVRPRRIPDEPAQPAAELWRDAVIVASNRFVTMDFKLEPVSPPKQLADVPQDAFPQAARDWMAKYVKVVGPAFYALPLAEQLTEPSRVLTERYATRLDYVRTLAGLLRGAGFEADVVLAADNADEPESVRRRDKFEEPNPREFSVALVRLRLTEGGWLGFGGETREIFLGTENEYTPFGATSCEGSDYFDPSSGAFGVVTVPDAALATRIAERRVIDVREDGAVDMSLETKVYGAGVGAFRRRYAEILPEERSRRYQSILGEIAQAASATSELETDLTSYPAVRRFSCYVPDYATAEGGTLSLRLPALISSVPTFAGRTRRTPFAVGASENQTEEIVVCFPEGYTAIEHLPEPFVFADPNDPARIWIVSTVTSRVVEKKLEVTLRRAVLRRASAAYRADVIELVKDRSRIASSRANRTLVVRRK